MEEKWMSAMKAWPVWIKAPVLMIVNALPYVGMVFLYEFGAPLDVFVFPVVFSGLLILNYHVCGKIRGFVLIQLFEAVCIFLSGNLSTYLYYHNISSDWATPAVGKLVVMIELTVTFLATAGLTITKCSRERKTKKD